MFLTQGTILVVEDAQELRRALVGALEFVGATVISAADGLEALEIIRSHPDSIRLILCDLMMPNMDAVALRAALRQDRRLYQIPFVLMSAVDSIGRALEETEAVAFLEKPFKLQALEELVHAWQLAS